MSKDLENPTYDQLKEGAKKGLDVSYKFTTESRLQLSVNGVHDVVFSKNELGQSQIIATGDIGLVAGVSSVVIHGWNDKK